MINLTASLILTSPVNATGLDKRIRSAIRFAIEQESLQLGAKPGQLIKYNKGQSCFTFGYYFEQELTKTSLFDEEFLRAACVISQMRYPEKQESIPGLASLLTITFKPDFHGKKIKGSRTGLRIMLMRLWQQGLICLPIGFYLQQSIKDDLLKTLLTEVSSFLWHYEPSKVAKPQNHPVLGSWDDSDIRQRVYRLLFSTDWHTFEQVNLDDLAKMHKLVLKGAEWMAGIRFPFIPMLKELMAQHESRLNFTTEDLRIYEQYTNGGSFNEYEFDYFHQNFDQVRQNRKRIYAERNVRRYRKEIITSSGYEVANNDILSLTPKQHILTQIAQKNTHEAALEYFKTLSSLSSALCSVTSYPGREHIEIETISSLWLKIFEDFLEFRAATGSEESDGLCSELKLLKDYLFCYLPWWKELHPNVSIDLPVSPVDFERFTFFRGSASQTTNFNKSPLPFLEVLKQRQKTTNSAGRTISALHALYNYIAAFADKYDELKNCQIKNPVVLQIDYPRGRKGKSKTNKPPFSKQVVPFLLRFLYAVEKFGMHLQELAFEGKLNFGSKSQPNIFVAADFDIEMKINFDGKSYEIKEIPNVFSLCSRLIKLPNGKIESMYIPHLSIIRMLIVMFETGLRGQSVQWLDKRFWDSGNQDKSPDTKIYGLYVNTDKTKNDAWVAPLIYRAREVLLREQQFQESIVEENMDREIPYENRKNSRFRDVVPLFRNSGNKGYPIADGAYHQLWTKLLASFQKFYNSEVNPENFAEFVKLSPVYQGGFEHPDHVVIHVRTESNEQIEYCPVEYKAIHTPHSMRSTFISLRSGIINIEDIAAMVGHTSIITTSHYTVKSFDDITEKLFLADSEISRFDSALQTHIRADKPNSQLQKSWRKNPQETEKTFGFVSVSLLNERTENFEDGVELLRTTPANQVTFRETHICPVGETCPSNIIDLIHEPRRCGLCPLAVKCVDHAPAIAAKMRQLLEQMRCASDVLEKRKARKEPEATLNEINERRKLDVLEFMGWQRTLDALNEILNSAPPNDISYLVDRPEIVKLHLKCVTKQSSGVEFIVDRILDSNSYPILETPELCAKANVLRQQLLANTGKISEALAFIPAGDEVQAFISSMSVAMATFNLSAEQLIERGLLDFNSARIEENLNALPLLLAARNEILIGGEKPIN